MMWRVVSVLLLSCFYFGRGTAQIILQPQVEIVSSSIALSNSRPLEELDNQITEYLSAYVPPIQLSLIPTRPIDTRIQITLRSGDGQRFVGDIEMVMTRPIYGKMDQSPLFVITDREVPFEIQSSTSFASFGQSLPSDPLLLRLVTYVLEGMVAYYDSFDTHGGNALLSYLKKESPQMAKAWERQATTASTRDNTPDIWIREMESAQGAQFRELWYIYHREILDRERKEVVEENLSLVIPLMVQLYRELQIPNLFQMLADAKPSEILQLIDGVSPSKRSELKSAFQELFPTFVQH